MVHQGNPITGVTPEMLQSPAYKIAALVWKECNDSPIWSYRRLNSAMHGAVDLAIQSGAHFKPNDFKLFSSEFRSQYWGDAEVFYSRAVEENNISACHALEHDMNRKPWIVKFDNNIGSAYRTGGRLAVGSQFSWWDCRGVMAFRRNVTVTSFSDDSETLIACAPQTEPIENRMAAKEVMKELLQKEEPVTNTVNNPAKKYRFTRADLCPRKERHGKIPS